jgi:flagellar motility protein MotE (MotC chaperone)
MTRARHARTTEGPARAGWWARALVVALVIALGGLAVVRLGLAVHGLANLPTSSPKPAVERAPAVPPEPFWPALPEPGAGPETAPPEPHGAPLDKPLPAAPAPPPPRLPTGTARLTASEIELLHRLAARRDALDQRARALDQREALIATATAGLERQVARLADLHADITALIERHEAAEEAKLTSLVKIYETMKPKAAAEIFDRLEMAVLIRVVERMREAKSADVLARMDPVKARQVTAELARRTRFLEAEPAAGAAARTESASHDG